MVSPISAPMYEDVNASPVSVVFGNNSYIDMYGMNATLTLKSGNCYRLDLSEAMNHANTLSIWLTVGGSGTQPTGTAVQAAQADVQVNGVSRMFEAYMIDDSNYFKLRDLAYVLSGTEKQFEVSWDEAQQKICLTTGAAYTAVGDEMVPGSEKPQSAQKNIVKLLDGQEQTMTAYIIGGNNYLKLRDLA